MKVKRGDVVYLKNTFPMCEHVQGGNRPYVVVSNDVGNFHSTVCMLVPLTTSVRKHPLPTHTWVSYGNSLCLCEQIFTISQDSISTVKCTLDGHDMENINRCLQIALGCRGW